MMKDFFDTVIKISSLRAELVVEQESEGIVSRKTMTPETFFKAILGSRYDDGVHPTGLLPEHCFSVTLTGPNILYYFRYPELCADISYHGTVYVDFPLPRLVFSVRYMPDCCKIGDTRLAVVKDEHLTPDTVIYNYPFSNVYKNHQICLGNNALPIYKDPTRIHTLMRLILSFPNNDDMFSEKNNKLGMGYRDLLEHLKDKDPAYYYTDVLIPMKKTLKDFMNGR